jgi:DNA-directed RNA polymerase sigma subunit (sigma70/sigma32)
MRLLNPSPHAYEDVGRNQVYLTQTEEIELVNRYKKEREELHLYILERTRCVRCFLDRYRETREAGRSIAKLSADYNPRKAGLNKSIEDRFKRVLDPTAIRRGKPGTLAGRAYMPQVLFDLHLSDDVYAEMLTCLRPTAKLKAIQEEISEIENTLLCSMLMAGQEIAKRYASNLLSVDVADAGQQVSIFLLESIRRYDPDYRTPKGNRVKLCTFAYGRSEQLLKEWILANSRLVRVPRSKMERILIVTKAYDELVPNDINLFTLSLEANKIVKERSIKKKKKLVASDLFTVDEVDELIKILMSNYIHLDQPYRRDSKSNSTTIGEMLSKEQPSAEDTIEQQDSKELLIEVMQDNLEDVEFQIIMLRWFHDPTDKVPKALTEVGALLVSEYDGPAYSRESIRLIEQKAIAKLKDVEEVQKLWSH